MYGTPLLEPSIVIDGNIAIGKALFVWGVLALRGRERESER